MLRARVLCAAIAALIPIGVAAPLTLTPAVASADAAGDKLLGELDAQITKAKSHYFEYDVENQEPGKAMKKLGMNVWIQGEKRLSELTAPADMKGTKVLILSPTQMYVYVPSLGKVRKIASSVGDQSTMGLTFSQDDFANQTYASMYTATKNGDDKLTLTPKSGVTAPYGKLEITFTKDKKLISEIKYYNAKGTHLKTEARTGYTCEQDVCTPKELKMTDHTKGGHWSKFTRKAWKVNQKFADDLFTKRSLGE